MMDHISSQFKNELQKKFGGGSLLLSREFVTQFSAKMSPHEKNWKKNTKCGLISENAESLK